MAEDVSLLEGVTALLDKELAEANLAKASLYARNDTSTLGNGWRQRRNGRAGTRNIM